MPDFADFGFGQTMSSDESFRILNGNGFAGDAAFTTDDHPGAQKDPTLKLLFDNKTPNFHAYPEDLTNVQNPGHFVMFQMFKVEGISVLDAALAVKNIASIGANSVGNATANRARRLFSDTKTGFGEFFGGDGNGNDEDGSASAGQIESENFFNFPVNRPENDGIADQRESLTDFNKINSLTNRVNSVSDESLQTKKDLLGKRKTLVDTIALYMPDSLSASYSFNYSEEETLLSSGVRSVVDWMNNPSGRNNSESAVRDVQKYAQSAGIRLGGGAINLLGQDISGQVSSVTRKVLNPHLEFLFKQVNLRNFSYSFNFFPRNEREVETVYEIIKKFKIHAHPIYDDKTVFLTMPSEFEIIFFSSNKENRFMSRVLPCVLTGVEVNYSPNGQAAFFKEVREKGQSPVQIQATLSFSEVGLLHRGHIEAGF